MSTRALKKLHGEDELAQLASTVANGKCSNEDDIGIAQPVKPNKKSKKKKPEKVTNPFDLLNEDAALDENTAHHTEETADAQTEVLEETPKASDELKPEGGAVRKQKKKKKKKKKGPEEQEAKQEEEDIDATIQEVNAMFGDTVPSGSTSTTVPSTSVHMKALLTVEHKLLNPDNEMKKIFGSRVVQAAEQNRRRHRNKAYHRSTWLAQPKDTWPHIGRTGLSMRLEESSRGVQWFAFEHNQAYQQVQFQFLDAVESLNPQNIMTVLNMHPYHIDSLIQLSEVCRMGEDMQMATELIERALYVFEVSFHPSFSLTQGVCRLSYRRPENRAFYIALFKHTLYVGQKGCNRTALEFCKLLLSLDPDEDPLAVLLMIDFYALRSEQYAFLIRLYQDWEGHRNLSQLPNFAFSVALATYQKAEQEEKDTEHADSLLQTALLMFPGVLMPLLDKCGVNPDNQVEAHAYFNTVAQLRQPAALRQLVALYVGRCHACWKIPEVMAWLEQNVRVVMARVDSGDPLAKTCQERNASRYRGTPRNILRHIIMSEIKDATAALPPEMANTPVLSYDPLPPKDSITSYTRPPRPTRAQQDSSALAMFFRSLLPDFNPQEIAEEVPEGAEGGQPANVREGVNALMNAMRELLQNIRPAEPPVENQHGDQPGGQDPDQGEWD